MLFLGNTTFGEKTLYIYLDQDGTYCVELYIFGMKRARKDKLSREEIEAKCKDYDLTNIKWTCEI